MNESGGIDSFFTRLGMPRPYSNDLRERAIEAVEAGASRREAADRFEVSPSSVINWLRRWHEDRSAVAKASGGSVSPLEKRADWLLTLIAKHPDLTLEEVIAAMRKRRMPGSRSALSRFFIRHNVTYKKKPARHGARPTGRGPRAQPLESRARHA